MYSVMYAQEVRQDGATTSLWFDPRNTKSKSVWKYKLLKKKETCTLRRTTKQTETLVISEGETEAGHLNKTTTANILISLQFPFDGNENRFDLKKRERLQLGSTEGFTCWWRKAGTRPNRFTRTNQLQETNEMLGGGGKKNWQNYSENFGRVWRCLCLIVFIICRLVFLSFICTRRVEQHGYFSHSTYGTQDYTLFDVWYSNKTVKKQPEDDTPPIYESKKWNVLLFFCFSRFFKFIHFVWFHDKWKGIFWRKEKDKMADRNG